MASRRQQRRPTKPEPAETDQKVVRAPSPRQYVTWTPQMVRSAIRQAETGNIESAVNLCIWLLTDDAVAGALSARVDTMLGLPVNFEPATEDAPEDIIETLKADWSISYPESELSQILTWGILLGGSLARHNPQRINGRVLPMLSFWLPLTLKQDLTTGLFAVRDAENQTHELVPGDGEWLFSTPGGVNRFWSHGLWQSVALLVVAKQYAIQDWNKTSEKASTFVFETHLDRDGNPVVATTDKQRRALVDEMDTRGGDACVALPGGWQLKLLQTADTYHIYMDQITMLNNAIAARIRGGNLTTQTQGGSFAAAETQAEWGDASKLRKDSATLGTMLREQSLRYYTDWNFGQPDNAPWPKWETKVAKEIDATRSYAVVALANGGFQLDLDILRDQYGFDFITGYEKPIDPRAGGDGGNPMFAQAHHHIRAAASPPTPAQVFIDRVVDQVVESAPLAVSSYELLTIVNEVSTEAELRTKLLEVFASLNQDALQSVFERAFLLAELAGRYAILNE